MAARVKPSWHELDGLEKKTSRNSFEMPARVKPNQHPRNWIGKKSSAIQTEGMARAKPSQLPMTWNGESFAAEFGAARVKPGRNWTAAEEKSFAGHSKMQRG
jgi:hypothetical protein